MPDKLSSTFNPIYNYRKQYGNCIRFKVAESPIVIVQKIPADISLYFNCGRNISRFNLNNASINDNASAVSIAAITKIYNPKICPTKVVQIY